MVLSLDKYSLRHVSGPLLWAAGPRDGMTVGPRRDLGRQSGLMQVSGAAMVPTLAWHPDEIKAKVFPLLGVTDSTLPSYSWQFPHKVLV